MKKAVKKKSAKVAVAKTEVSELRKLTYIFCIIIALFLVFYGIAYLKSKNESMKDDDIASTIQYDGILMNNIGKQDPKEYYVIAYTNVEDFKNMYRPYVNTYITLEKSLNFYFSDMNDDFNSEYVGEKSNLKDINNLKISGDVLIKIKDGKITNTYQGTDAIIKQLKTLCQIKN